MMHLARAILLSLLCLTGFATSTAAQGPWVLWSGIETVGGPLWKKAETFASRSDCDEGSERYTKVWVSRMESEGRQPVRVGTDVIARMESGSILTVHFVCLPDDKDPRVR